jgi:hypothetical protein
MALSDMVLKTRVNVALLRDPRVGVLDVGVQCHNGRVMLTGDVDSEDAKRAAEAIAATVIGVRSVRNDLTVGVGKGQDSAEWIAQKFLDRLSEAWDALPDQNALTQADYLRWALWMIYKFRIPVGEWDDAARVEADAMEQALTRVASYVGAPKALIALELIRQAEFILQSADSNAPEIYNAPLVATPFAAEDEKRAA